MGEQPPPEGRVKDYSGRCETCAMEGPDFPSTLAAFVALHREVHRALWMIADTIAGPLLRRAAEPREDPEHG